MRNIFFPHYLSGEPFSARLDDGVYAIKKEYRLVLLCDPFGARTQDPNIKSVVLYQLS